MTRFFTCKSLSTVYVMLEIIRERRSQATSKRNETPLDGDPSMYIKGDEQDAIFVLGSYADDNLFAGLDAFEEAARKNSTQV